MPAVVRIKRRIDEEPLGAFVLNGKRRRIDNGESTITTQLDLFDTKKDEISTILKFAGTVQSQDENVTTQITRLTKDEATELAKKHRQPTISATELGRQEMRARSNENRFKVVNCFRAIDTGNANDVAPKEITIVDIEKEPLVTAIEKDPANIATTSSSKRGQQNEIQPASIATNVENFTPTDGDGYVYDLYLPENEQQADDVDYTDNYLSIRAYEELVYEDCFNNEEGEESEDSNEENHFGNDYPDEEDGDDDDSINLRDMRRAIESVNFDDNDGDELSSDEEELETSRNGFVFSIDTLEDDFEDDVDFRDVDRYGIAYARYKKKILREMKEVNSEDDEYGDDDSDHSRDDNGDNENSE